MGKELAIDSMLESLRFNGRNFILDEKDKEIALNILRSLSEADLTIARAREIMSFCNHAVELISRVGR